MWTHQFWVCPLLASTCCVEGHAVPLRWSAHTNVMSIANCMPQKIGRPSATTSNLLPSNASRGAHKSKSRTMMLHETLAPASRHTLAAAISTANLVWPTTPSLGARCAMVAKRVLMAATSTQVNCGRERLAETAEQQNPEQVRLQAGVKVSGNSGERHSCQRSCDLSNALSHPHQGR